MGGGQGDCGAANYGDCPTEEGCRAPYSFLGQLKQYASSSYDAKFSDIYTQTHPLVDPSGSSFNGSIGGRVEEAIFNMIVDLFSVRKNQF